MQKTIYNNLFTDFLVILLLTSLLSLTSGAAFGADSDVILRAAVMSDVHFPGSLNARQVERFNRALDFMYEYSSKQPYKKFDALVIAGDMTDSGSVEQLTVLKKSMDEHLRPETTPVFCMGNHDWAGGQDRWEKILDMKANQSLVINGIHFLTASIRFEQLKPWLKEELDKAIADDPNKPVIVVQHHHINNTVYGSCPPDNWGGAGALRDLLDNYPQVIDFSGHSHYPIVDPRSAWQKTFSAFGCRTLSYYEMTGGGLNKFPEGHTEAAEFYVMEICRNHRVVLKLYDLRTNSFYPRQYVVEQPGNPDSFTYTQSRFELASNPYWEPGAAITIKSSDQDSGCTEIAFPQAKDQELVTHYRIDAFPANAPNGKPTSSQYEWSNYFYQPLEPIRTVELTELPSDADILIKITAVNCYNKESKDALSVKIHTPKDLTIPDDSEADSPKANLIDVSFSKQGPVNTATLKKEIEKLGAPQLITADNGAITAKFDGKSDFYRIRFSASEYQRMRRAVTLVARFKIEAPDQTADIFANTEGGGYCLEYNGTTKQLEFWCHINGSYKILRAPVDAGRFVTAAGVYDGSQLVLYIDGKEAARQAANGLITYPTNKSAHAFCIGADINGNGNGSSFFFGQVEYAKLFSWGLKAKQVKNLP